MGKDNTKYISAIVVNKDNPKKIDIYVTDGKDQIWWKSVAAKTLLEEEGDVNFQ